MHLLQGDIQLLHIVILLKRVGNLDVEEQFWTHLFSSNKGLSEV